MSGRGKGWKRIRAMKSVGACAVWNCDKPELVHVGAQKTPLCRRHYEAWLEMNEQVLEAALTLFDGARQ